ncbi:MAG: alpha/beta hydrolase, partial [Lentisphaeria bacterium]|nr:alpha/beta hydrolase [Lentisphaeria bacterium]NQZ70358.1 alpha/beta hydrolase [Lentisphaeria bacterium]
SGMENYDPFKDISKDKQQSIAPILFATNRKIRHRLPTRFGSDRSRMLHYGISQVEFGKNMPWKKLYRLSTSMVRDADLNISIKETQHYGSIPEHTITKNKKPKNYQQNLVGLINQQLAQSKDKELFLFIHGFNNTFNETAMRLAQMWHFMGRKGVPFLFSWPAGREGVTGYFMDKESGKYSVYHLKICLEAIAKSNAKKVHIIAHSHGTEIIASALREFYIKYKNSGKDPGKYLKLTNLIFAAADIDIDVFVFRILAENIHLMPKRLTIYINGHDRVLSISQWIHQSFRRIGLMTPQNITPDIQEIIRQFDTINFIYIPFRVSYLSHSYFLDNPAVSSDLIKVLRDNAKPGDEYGRPLECDKTGIWKIYPSYPKKK